MTSFRHYYEMLDKAQPVEEEEWHAALAAFIHNFVVKDKRSRWRHLCLEKPEKARRNEHRLHGDLLWERSSACDAHNTSPITRREDKGILYDFTNAAWWVSPREALDAAHGHDAILCLDGGKLAVYFFHELEDYIFRNPG